ncbi:MAG: shikimate dehydrogenase [Paracoccaceae bacterium]
MTGTKKIPLAGVIGSPIAHSRSPFLHGHWLKRYDLAGHYIPMDVSQADLPDVLRMLPKMGFVGVNVTIPHKESVIRLADVVTDRAAVIGAANTLTFRRDGKLQADNTDGFGFMENLRKGAPDWDPRSGSAVVYGAGGASRAVLASLLDAGVPSIRLANRTRGRAEALREEFGTRIEVHDWNRAGAMLEGAALAVNTTALGMSGQPPLSVPLDALSSDTVVTDLVYNPLETPFLRAALERGCRTVDGLGMLLYQALPGFERWFGKRPEVDDALRRAVLAG